MSDSMMYSLPILCKKKFFPMGHPSKIRHYGFCFLQSPQGRSSWGLSWFWPGMNRGRSMPNLVLYSKFAVCSKNFVVMLFTIELKGL